MDTMSAIEAVVDGIENELKTLDLWASEPPSQAALSSEQPFCYDTLGFIDWLQWVFLPRINDALAEPVELPERSGIFAYAEEVMRDHEPPPDQLLFLIRTFDELVEMNAATGDGAGNPAAVTQ
jgi:uncharacterized protein YqcC (DUF446 family)